MAKNDTGPESPNCGKSGHLRTFLLFRNDTGVGSGNGDSESHTQRDARPPT